MARHIDKTQKQIETKKAVINREYYSLRSVLGYWWAMFIFLLGGREAGKSYAVTEFFVRQWRAYKRPFYWLRLTDASQKKLLNNNAEKLIDADIKRRYNLDIVVNNTNVYEVLERDKKGKIKKKALMARVLALSTFYNDKGSGLFDKDFLKDNTMYYNICLDEMNREAGEKKSFDIVYAFVNQMENIVRSTKKRLRCICIGNTLEEASDMLCALNFIPEQFGRFKLKSKRAIVEYIEPSEKYLARRKGTIADILMPRASTFTNKIETDTTLIEKKRLLRPLQIIKFSKDKESWFTVWDAGVIAPYNGENVPAVAMKPYLDEPFFIEQKSNVYLLFDSRSYRFKNLITFKRFQQSLELLRPKR